MWGRRFSFMDELRAMPTTSAAKSGLMRCEQPPGETMAMAQPGTILEALEGKAMTPTPRSPEPFAPPKVPGAFCDCTVELQQCVHTHTSVLRDHASVLACACRQMNAHMPVRETATGGDARSQ